MLNSYPKTKVSQTTYYTLNLTTLPLSPLNPPKSFQSALSSPTVSSTQSNTKPTKRCQSTLFSPAVARFQPSVQILQLTSFPPGVLFKYQLYSALNDEGSGLP